MSKDNEVVIINFVTRQKQVLEKNPVEEIEEVEASNKTTHLCRTERNRNGTYSMQDTRYNKGELIGYSGGASIPLDALIDRLPLIGDLRPVMGALQSIRDIKIKK